MSVAISLDELDLLMIRYLMLHQHLHHGLTTEFLVLLQAKESRDWDDDILLVIIPQTHLPIHFIDSRIESSGSENCD